MSRSCGATTPHTAHHLQHGHVSYRYHPFFGQDVEIVRTLRQQAEPSVIIRLECELQIAIPVWMLEPEHCSALTDELRPRIALRALVELRELMDAHPLLPEVRSPISRRKPCQRGTDEQENAEASATGVTGSRPR